MASLRNDPIFYRHIGTYIKLAMNSIDIKHEKFYYYRNSLDTLIPFTLNTVHNQTNVMPKNNNSLQLMMAS